MKRSRMVVGLILAVGFLGGCRASEVSAAKATYRGEGASLRLDKDREGPVRRELIIERGEPKSHPVFIPVPDNGGDSDAE